MAAYFDVAPEGALSLPALIGFSLANATKFHHDGEFTPDNVVAFAHAARLGKLLPHIRSSPSVKSSGPLVELVGSNFFEVAKDPSKDVLVHFYSSTCGHCKKLFPVYTKVAEHFADEPEVVVAQIDAIANDIPSVEPAGYPTVLLYPKGAKRPIEYDGSRDSFDVRAAPHPEGCPPPLSRCHLLPGSRLEDVPSRRRAARSVHENRCRLASPTDDPIREGLARRA